MFTYMIAGVSESAPPAPATDEWVYQSLRDATNGGADDLTHIIVLSDLPAGVTDIEIMSWDISTSSANEGICVQIGDAGGFEATSYDQSVKRSGSPEFRSDGFFAHPVATNDASNLTRSIWRLFRWDTSLHLWIYWGSDMENTDTSSSSGVGFKTLSGEITQVQITTDSEVSNFDNGTVIGRYK